MSKDTPYIVALVGLLFALVLIGSRWYMTNNVEESAMTTLNNNVRTSAIQHINMKSRVDMGSLFINQDGNADIIADPYVDPNSDFESTVMSKLTGVTDGAQVRFDYVTTAELAETPDTYPVTVYRYSETDGWVTETTGIKDNWRPLEDDDQIEAIRVQYRQPGHASNSETTDLDDPDYWTYQSTIQVDRSDFSKDVEVAQDAANEPVMNDVRAAN